MRSRTTAENNLITAGAMAAHCRVSIQDSGGTYQSYEDWAYKVSIRDDIDAPVMEASVTLMFRDAPSTNYSPLAGSTLWGVGRRVKVEAGIASVGGSPATWHNIFEGIIESYSFERDHGITFKARDLAQPLTLARVETSSTYGSGAGIAMETVMASILTAWGGSVSLYTPVSPSYLINTYTIEDVQTVKQALDSLADLIGWIVRYRWDSGTSAWRLTLYQPNRGATTPDYTVPSTLYSEDSSFELDTTAIVNALAIAYGSGTSRATYTATDSASITAFGRRFARISESSSSPIDTLAEAQAFGNSIIADLKDPKAAGRFNLGWFPWVEVGDYYRFSADSLRYTSDQDLAVVGFEHMFEVSESGDLTADTVVTVRGKPAGAYYRWWDMIPPVEPPSNTTPPGTPTSLSGSFTGPDALLSWTAPTNVTAEGYEVKVYNGVSPNQLLRTITVTDTRYSYDYAANLQDGGPRPDLDFEVRAIYGRNLSSAASTTLVNAAPSAPASVTLVGEPLRYRASVPEPTFADYLRTEWQSDDNGSFTSPTSAASGPDWQGVPIGLEAGAGTTHVRARFVDMFGQVSGWTTASSAGVLVGSANISASAITTSLLAPGAVTYEKLVIGDTSNAFPDPQIAVPANWTFAAQWTRQTGYSSDWIYGVGFNNSGPIAGDSDLRTPYFPVEPGQRYVIWMQRNFPGGGSGNVTIAAEYLPSAFETAQSGSFSGGGIFAGVVTPPSNASQMRILIRRSSGGSGQLDVGSFVVRKAGIGEVIIDGTVTGTRASFLDFTTLQATFGGGANKAVADSKGVRVYDGSSNVRVGVGDISGLLYGSGGLPSDTNGLYVRGGGAFLTDYPRLIFITALDTASNFGSQSVAAGASNSNLVTLTHGVGFTLIAGRRLIGAPRIIGVSTGNANLVISKHSVFIEGYNSSTSAWEIITRVTGPKTYTDFRTIANLEYLNPTGSSQTSAASLTFVTEIYEAP